MPNKNYVKGRKKEYAIVNKYKAIGCLAFRSAGSHSPIDVVVINPREHEIILIQSKPESMSDNKKEELRESLKFLDGTYKVYSQVE